MDKMSQFFGKMGRKICQGSMLQKDEMSQFLGKIGWKTSQDQMLHGDEKWFHCDISPYFLS
jgi:hypothetical protein